MRSGTLETIQSIALPDGSSYSFTCGSYGEMTSMTPPTGGTVYFGWENFNDSYNNQNRWLISYSGSHGSMSFNRYSYVQNNPLGLTDPNGQFPLPCSPVDGTYTLCESVFFCGPACAVIVGVAGFASLIDSLGHLFPPSGGANSDERKGPIQSSEISTFLIGRHQIRQ